MHTWVRVDTLPHPFQPPGPRRKTWNLTFLGLPWGLWPSVVKHSQVIGLDLTLIFLCEWKIPKGSCLHALSSYFLKGHRHCHIPLEWARHTWHTSSPPLWLLSTIPRPWPQWWQVLPGRSPEVWIWLLSDGLSSWQHGLLAPIAGQHFFEH